MSIFTGQYIYDYFKNLYDAIERKINSYDYRQLKDFSSADIDLIVNYYRIQNVAVDFDNSRREVKNGEGEIYNFDSQVFEDEQEYIDVKGKYITFYAPIIGDWSLLKYSLGEQGFEMLNYYDKNYEDIEPIHNPATNSYSLKIVIFIPDYEFKNKDKDKINELVKVKLNNYIHTTTLKIKRLNAFIDDYNDKLPKIVGDFIKTKINDDSSLEFVSDAIGVKVHSKISSQNEGSKIEILPKKADFLLPNRKKYDGYYLDKENYSAIISTIKNHLIATENNPKAIKTLNNEELIRDTILWFLNSNYFVATGETFRENGKTDILISFNDRSVFVAECKIWKGSQYFSEGIDQLLGYTTWRDSKMAMIVFNLNNQDFSLVCSEAKQCMEKHLFFKRIVSCEKQNFFECEFVDPNNQDSLITIAVMCANYVNRKEVPN